MQRRLSQKLASVGRALAPVPKASFPYIVGLGIIALLYIALGATLFYTVNSDFFAAGPEKASSPDAQFSKTPDVHVVIRLVSLSETSSTLQVAVSARVEGALRDEVLAGKRSIVIKVGLGYSDWGTENVAIVKIDKDSPTRRSFSDPIESEPVMGNAMVFRDVPPYPYDDYETQLDITVTDATGYHSDLPFTTQVVKLIAGRRMRAGLSGPTLANIKLVRPRMQQFFVVSAAGVYVLIIVGISFLLFKYPGKQTPQELIFACAGLLLGSVGFRDLIGCQN